MPVTKSSRVNSFYVILSGFFKYNSSELDSQTILQQFNHWKTRISEGDYASTFEYLNQNYYDTYLNNSYPEIRKPEQFENRLSKSMLNHLTLSGFNFDETWQLVLKGEHLSFLFDYIDLYLYPSDIGIFSIKCKVVKDELTVGDVSDFTNSIRNLESQLINGSANNMSVQYFIERFVLNNLSFDKNWKIFNPQLKSYIQVDLFEDVSEDELNYLLFDLGNVSPIGSAKGEGMFAPHISYYQEQMNNNKLTVFNNWSALSLYDTFTRVSINFEDRFKSWEYDYFNIYIHCLYIKFYMYITNTAISEVTVINKKTARLRDNFIEFINDYYHSHISYKFLPDMIQDKLIYSLEIQSEIEKMETKIKRINEHARERAQKMMNLVLLVITLLSVSSLIHDLSNYAIHMGAAESSIYPMGSIYIGLALISGLIIFFKIKLRR